MRDIIQLLEAKSKPKDVEVIKLNFTDRDVSSVFSKNTIDLHYGKLAHAYASRYNAGEGDPDFKNDRSRIYISQNTMIDQSLDLVGYNSDRRIEKDKIKAKNDD